MIVGTFSLDSGFRERIRCTLEWRSGEARQDCIFVRQDPNLPGIHGPRIVQVKALLKFKHNQVTYPCALISWFKLVGDSPCNLTEMWVVHQEIGEDGQWLVGLIHLDALEYKFSTCHASVGQRADFVLGRENGLRLMSVSLCYSKVDRDG
jgi:hypothetical protein